MELFRIRLLGPKQRFVFLWIALDKNPLPTFVSQQIVSVAKMLAIPSPKLDKPAYFDSQPVTNLLNDSVFPKLAVFILPVSKEVHAILPCTFNSSMAHSEWQTIAFYCPAGKGELAVGIGCRRTHFPPIVAEVAEGPAPFVRASVNRFGLDPRAWPCASSNPRC